MWKTLKSFNPIKNTASDGTRRNSEDLGASPGSPVSPAAHAFNASTSASLSSMTGSASFSRRNIFRRSRLPSDFSGPGSSPSNSPRPSLSETYDASTSSPTPVARLSSSHSKHPSGSSMRSIMRTPHVPGTGQSVRFNGRDAYRDITPEVSGSTEDGDSRSFARRLLESSMDEDDRQSPLNPGQHRRFLDHDVFDNNPDPFAAQVLRPPTPVDTLNSVSFTSALDNSMQSTDTAQSSSDLPDMPSSMDNLLDTMLDQSMLDRASVAESLLLPPFEDVAALRNPRPISPNNLTSFTFPPSPSATPRRNNDNEHTIIVLKSSSSAPNSPFTPQHTSSLSYATTTPPSGHSRQASEVPTIRPSPRTPPSADQSQITQGNTSSVIGISSPPSALASTPDVTVYHTPTEARRSIQEQISYTTTNEDSQRSQAESSFEMPPFLLQKTPSPAPLLSARIVNEPPNSPELHAPNNSYASNTSIDGNGVPFPSNMSPFTSSFTSPNTSITTDISLNSDMDLVTHLRARLSLLESISVTYESDLHARDSFVTQLAERVSRSEEQCAVWKDEADKATRRYERQKSKLHHLTKACEKWEENHKRAQMFDRASETALRTLHTRVGSLDAGRVEMEERARAAEEAKVVMTIEKEKMMEEMEGWKRRVREMEEESEKAAEMLNSLYDPDREGEKILIASPIAPRKGVNEAQVRALKSEILKKEQDWAQVRESWRSKEVQWDEERIALTTALEEARVSVELAPSDASFDGPPSQEMDVLKAELEAQWTNTEKMNDEIEALRNKKNAAEAEVEQLRKEIQGSQMKSKELSTRVHELEEMVHQRDEALARTSDVETTLIVEQNEIRNLNSELAALKAEVESQQSHAEVQHERIAQLEAEAHHSMDDRSRVDELTSRLEELKETMQQLQWNRDKILEELQHERESYDQLQLEHATLRNTVTALGEERMSASGDQEKLQDLVHTLNIEITHLSADNEQYKRTIDDSSREISELRRALEETRVQLEGQLETVKIRTNELEVELEAARKKIKDGKAASAKWEMERVQHAKKIEQLEEDKNGLEIALDAKQEELELVKRKFGVRGTAGATPAQSSAAAPVSRSMFKSIAGRQPRFSLTNESNDGSSKVPSAASRPLSKNARPRMSAATPTPAVTLGRYPVLGHTRQSSSVSSIASDSPAQRPMAAPALNATSPSSSTMTTPRGPAPMRRSSSGSSVDSNVSSNVSAAAQPAGRRLIHRTSSASANLEERNISRSGHMSQRATSSTPSLRSPTSGTPPSARMSPRRASTSTMSMQSSYKLPTLTGGRRPSSSLGLSMTSAELQVEESAIEETDTESVSGTNKENRWLAEDTSSVSLSSTMSTEKTPKPKSRPAASVVEAVPSPGLARSSVGSIRRRVALPA